MKLWNMISAFVSVQIWDGGSSAEFRPKGYSLALLNWDSGN
jgi:hypothetical protein